MPLALITGATGFIGQYLLHDLQARGWQCRVLARTDRPELRERGSDVEIIKGDVTQPETLRSIAADVNVVFHLAGAGHVAAVSESDLQRFRAINVEGTRHMLAACVEHPVQRFVYVSSTAAMGLPDTNEIDETTAARPRTPYQRSKWEAEEVVRSFAAQSSMPATIVRPCMVYGPGGQGEFLKICRLIKRGILPKVGRSLNRMPAVYVTDVSAALLAAAERGRVGETYLIAGGSYSLEEIRARVLKALNLSRPVIPVPYGAAILGAGLIEGISRVLKRPPIVSRQNIRSVSASRWFNTAKAQRELDFVAQVDLAHGVPLTIDWYRENQLI
jgi:nucleoside-diphosphate-sugar epimerase